MGRFIYEVKVETRQTVWVYWQPTREKAMSMFAVKALELDSFDCQGGICIEVKERDTNRKVVRTIASIDTIED